MDQDIEAIRERLLRRISDLSPEGILALEAMLKANLECGALSPLLDLSAPTRAPSDLVLKPSNRQPLSVPPISGQPSPQTDWPHAPVHRISEHGTYIVTAGTLDKKHFFRSPSRLDLLQSKLLTLADQYGWQLDAWAVFSNHYHFVAHSAPDSATLDFFLKHLHADTAREINALDEDSGRQVWHNYWDTKLTYENSYFARLNYVHQNAVKHGLVRVANEYRWCSAAWFEKVAKASQIKTIYGFKIDKVRIDDDFSVER